MTTTGNQVIDNFIIEVSLISPINDILSKLKDGNFRDCDLKWLDKKLASFTLFACETLGIKIGAIIDSPYETMNDYVKNIYIKRFNTLLEYFKAI